MKVCVLSSGSKGNTTYIETKKAKILIDCGNSCKYVLTKLAELDVYPSDIDAILITHVHVDHVKGLQVLTKQLDIPVYMTEKMYPYLDYVKNYVFIDDDIFKIKDIDIEVIKTSHDAEDSVGYIVNNDNKSVVYVTDTGYINKTPLVQFAYRVNKTINMAAEKTTEMMLDKIVHDSAGELGFFLSDYCVYPNYDVEPGRYDFLIETGAEGPGVPLEELKACIGRNLKKVNPVYAYIEGHGQLSAPEVYLLQPETCLLYRDMMAFKGANLSQLKPVHIITNERQRKFFFGLTEEMS